MSALDVGATLAALGLEAAAALVFAAGVICDILLTCCCLSRRCEHADFQSRLKKEPCVTVSDLPLPKSLWQCEKVYYPVSGSKFHLNPSGMVAPMSKDLCSKCLSPLKKNKKA